MAILVSEGLGALIASLRVYGYLDGTESGRQFGQQLHCHGSVGASVGTSVATGVQLLATLANAIIEYLSCVELPSVGNASASCMNQHDLASSGDLSFRGLFNDRYSSLQEAEALVLKRCCVLIPYLYSLAAPFSECILHKLWLLRGFSRGGSGTQKGADSYSALWRLMFSIYERSPSLTISRLNHLLRTTASESEAEAARRSAYLAAVTTTTTTTTTTAITATDPPLLNGFKGESQRSGSHLPLLVERFHIRMLLEQDACIPILSDPFSRLVGSNTSVHGSQSIVHLQLASPSILPFSDLGVGSKASVELLHSGYWFCSLPRNICDVV